MAAERSAQLEELKISCLSTGISITDRALGDLGGPNRLTIHEYATTGGICLELEESIYVNAPFDDWFVQEAGARLDVVAPGRYVVEHAGEQFPVQRVVPLPGYLETTNAAGERYDGVVMTHIDRVRLSPISGCAYDCHFCDLGELRYTRRPLERLLEALDVALADGDPPPSHVLISGGSPGRRDLGYFEETCSAVARHSPVPVDVMMSAVEDGPALVGRLVDSGVAGFAINIELYGDAASSIRIRQKHRFARPYFDDMVLAAVDRLGRTGAVRSLIIPGLEPVEETIAGIAHVAALGADPVISPFRPARGTKLVDHPPVPASTLREVLSAGRALAREHGVALGPRCAPCQHNVLAFPWDSATREDLARGRHREPS